MNSGTSALVGALKAVGVCTLKDHVVCQSYVCAASADAVFHAGGTPVIVDVERATFALSNSALIAALDADPLIVGVIIAPCYGVPAADLRKIRALCDTRKLWLIEDNCESYGARVDSTHLGSIGDMSVISLRSEKLIGVGEGGAIMSTHPCLVDKARWWCSRAYTVTDRVWHRYKHDAVGFNTRMPELLAAVGCAAAEEFESTLEKKRQIHTWYRECLSDTPRVQFQTPNKADTSVYWINAVLLPVDAESVGMRIMAKHPEIELRPGFYPLHLQDPFRANSYPCPNAEFLFKHVICLPSSVHLTRPDVEYISRSLIDGLKRLLCPDSTIQPEPGCTGIHN